MIKSNSIVEVNYYKGSKMIFYILGFFFCSKSLKSCFTLKTISFDPSQIPSVQESRILAAILVKVEPSKTAPMASSGSVLEIENLKPHPGSTKSESF